MLQRSRLTSLTIIFAGVGQNASAPVVIPTQPDPRRNPRTLRLTPRVALHADDANAMQVTRCLRPPGGCFPGMDTIWNCRRCCLWAQTGSLSMVSCAMTSHHTVGMPQPVPNASTVPTATNVSKQCNTCSVPQGEHALFSYGPLPAPVAEVARVVWGVVCVDEVLTIRKQRRQTQTLNSIDRPENLDSWPFIVSRGIPRAIQRDAESFEPRGAVCGRDIDIGDIYVWG